jgi:hypothetical protein
MWWDFTHGWSTLHYHLSERQNYRLPNLSGIAFYHGAHAIYYSPFLFLAALAGMFWAGVRGWRRKDDTLIFLFSFAVVTWFFFAFVAAVSKRILSREQWDAMAYVPALIAAACMAEHFITRAPGSRVSRMAGHGAVVAIATGFLFSGLIVTEGLTASASRLLGKRPAFSALHGWRQMADIADRHVSQLGEPGTVFIVGDSFRPTLQYAFYGRATREVYAMNAERNEKYGLDHQLQAWKISESFLRERRGGNAVFVADMTPEPRRSERFAHAAQLDRLRQMFQDVELAESHTATHAGHPVRLFRFYICRRSGAK